MRRRVGQPVFERVLTNGLQQPVPLTRPHHQRLLHQRRQQVLRRPEILILSGVLSTLKRRGSQLGGTPARACTRTETLVETRTETRHIDAAEQPRPAHLMHRHTRSPTHEHRQPRQQHPFRLRQQFPAPVDHRPQRPMPQRPGPRTPVEQPQPAVHPRLELRRRQRPGPRRRQLDSERNPVQRQQQTRRTTSTSTDDPTRATNSRTASATSSGATGSTTSPGIPSGSREVASTARRAPPPAAARTAKPPRRSRARSCPAPPATTRPARTPASPAGSGPERRRAPRSGSAAESSSTNHASGTDAAYVSASRVLPTPPNPVSVTNRLSRNSAASEASSPSRPTNDPTGAGRLPRADAFAQHRQVRGGQRLTGVHAQLDGQGRTNACEHRQRVRPPPGRVQRAASAGPARPRATDARPPTPPTPRDRRASTPAARLRRLRTAHPRTPPRATTPDPASPRRPRRRSTGTSSRYPNACEETPPKPRPTRRNRDTSDCNAAGTVDRRLVRPQVGRSAVPQPRPAPAPSRAGSAATATASRAPRPAPRHRRERRAAPGPAPSSGPPHAEHRRTRHQHDADRPRRPARPRRPGCPPATSSTQPNGVCRPSGYVITTTVNTASTVRPMESNTGRANNSPTPIPSNTDTKCTASPASTSDDRVGTRARDHRPRRRHHRERQPEQHRRHRDRGQHPGPATRRHDGDLPPHHVLGRRDHHGQPRADRIDQRRRPGERRQLRTGVVGEQHPQAPEEHQQRRQKPLPPQDISREVPHQGDHRTLRTEHPSRNASAST